jgi:phage shock protein C
MSDRLYRSRTDRIVAGVAGGVAYALRLDPSIVRVVWAVLIPVTGGLALLVYIVMAVVVPEEDELTAEGAVRPPTRPITSTPFAVPVGAALVVLGAYLLLREYLPALDLDRIWPVLLIGAGVILLIFAMRRRPDDPGGTR